MRIAIDFSLSLDGLARRLVDMGEDEMFNAGLQKASDQAREEIRTNFEVGGRPAWPLTEKGEVPLYETGRLKDACSTDAVVDQTDEGFEMVAASDREVVAEVQDKRYGIFVLPDEAQTAVADALEKGMMEE